MVKSRQAAIERAGQAIQAYQRSVQAFDDAVGRALELNPTDLRCLDWLMGGATAAGELSRRVGLSSAATTTLIDRLAEKGYVLRVSDPTDRRRVLVEMTPKGIGEANRFYGPLVGEGMTLLDGFSAAEIERMASWLDAARTLTDRHRARIEGS